MLQTNHHLTDKLGEIIQGCLNGERSSQGKLYHLYASKMMGVCMWYARNREEAEEVLQDGFMRVFRFIHTYAGQGSFEGWMRSVMVNVALSKYRTKPQLQAIISFDHCLHDVGREADFASQYDEKQLLKLVQALPVDCRMVFNLYVFEGFKHREIAAALGISEGTSKSNLNDARRLLKASLSKAKDNHIKFHEDEK